MKTQVWVQRSNRKALAKESFEPVTDLTYALTKPEGGLWTSEWDETTGGSWVRWCVGEEFDGPEFKLWLCEVDPFARIYTINDYQDLLELSRRYPKNPCACNTEGCSKNVGGINWPAVHRGWDAVHLTEEGQWKTRFTMPLSLYGWDCECTLWLNWSFTKVEYIGAKRFDWESTDA